MKFWLKGLIIGIVICFIIYLPYLLISTEATLNDPSKKFYYERFQLCEPCDTPRDLDCVVNLCKDVETEEFNKYPPQNLKGESLPLEEVLEYRCSKHPDIQSGCVDCFINGFCGYSQYPGFYYGKNPTIINSLLNFRTFQNAFRYSPVRSINLIWIFLIILILSSLIGYSMGKMKSKK